MKIKIEVDPGRSFANGSDSHLVEKLAAACKDLYQNDIMAQNSVLNGYEFELSGDHAAEDVRKQLDEIVRGIFFTDADGVDHYHISIDKCGEAPVEGQDEDVDDAEPLTTDISEDLIDSVAASILQTDLPEKRPCVSKNTDLASLVGAEQFKSFCGDLDKLAPLILKHKTQSIFFANAYVFSIDTGCGFHTALQLLKEILENVGLFTGSDDVKFIEMPDPEKEDVDDKLRQTLQKIKSCYSDDKCQIVSLDISDWIGHTDMTEFKQVLAAISEYKSNAVTVFRTQYLGDPAAELLEQDINDLIPVRTIGFPPFNRSQMQKIAGNIFTEYDYHIDENAWSAFDILIDNECADGYFYGIRTIRKVVESIIWQTQINSIHTGQDLTEITEDIIMSLACNSSGEDVSGSLEDLDNMIGMENIAAQVRQILEQIAYAHRHKIKIPSMHMCFVGNPGTGKTTAARIIGSVLRENGNLRIGHFFEHHARDFIARYVGWTSSKTIALCKQAYGSVLFIDEAYALVYDSRVGDTDYGREALDTLVAQMENHRDDMIIILAGYPDDMAEMCSNNSGLKDRIKYTINFPNYTRDQLYQIFIQMSEKQFSCSDGYKQHSQEFFNSLDDALLSSRDFGNARYCRNLYEKAWGHAIVRCPETDIKEVKLEAEDLDAAAAETSASVSMTTGLKRIGFSLQ